MKLTVNELKKFNSISGAIQQNRILPILSFLKFENGEITKNNLESFVTMKSDFIGSCLIDERVLMSFIETTTAKEIDIIVDGKKVVICDSDNPKKKTSSPTDNLLNFPKNTEPDGKEIEFSPELIQNIKIASNFTDPDMDSTPYAKYVYVGNGLVAGTTGFIAYTHPIEEKTPRVILGKNAVSVLSNFKSVFFSENNTYQFFNTGVFKFGFIKDDASFTDMTIFSKLPKGKSVVINKDEIIRFCERCVKSSPSKIVLATISGDKLSMVDKEYEIECEDFISHKMEDFSFMPTRMLKLLKAIPDQFVSFIKDQKKYYVSGDSGFVSLIMEIIP